MAVERGALRAGLGLRPGSVRLMALRLLTLIGLSLPVWLAARAGITSRFGVDPRLDPDRVQTVETVQALLTDLPPAALALAVVGLLAFWAFEQVLSAGALRLFDPGRRPGPARVWGTIWGDGGSHFWAFTRVAVIDLLLVAAGLAAVSYFATAISRALDAGGAGATAGLLLLPALIIGLARAGLSLVGVFGLWCRVLIVADDRRRVRRVPVLVLRVWWRAPWRGLVLFAAVLFAGHGLGAALLLLAAPGRGGSLASSLLWLLYAAVETYLWHFLLHAARRLYAEPRLAPVRAGSDEPFGVWPAVARLVRQVRSRSSG